MNARQSIVRVYIVYMFILLFACAVISQIVSLQFFHREELIKETQKRSFSMKTIVAPRGNIYADNEQKTSLSLSVPRYKLYLDLITIDDNVFSSQIITLSDSLSKIFPPKSKDQWYQVLKKQRERGNRYFLLSSEVGNDELKRIKKFPILKLGQFRGGLIELSRNVRIKPFGALASRTIGYVIENKNVDPILVGLEGAYNEELKGQNGNMLMEKIRGNEWKPVVGEYYTEPIPGKDIFTSIDVNLQDVAETALLHQLENQSALRGCAVLMEVKTGFIKAIANLTRNDETGTYHETLNHAIGLASEPGSTFKLASLMVALDDDKIKITDSVNMTGRYSYYNKSLTDGGKKYGKNTIQVAFEKSSNVISQIIHDNYKENPQEFIDGLKDIGLNERLGVSIIGEPKPYIKDADDPTFSGISLPWMSIGYEVQLSPLQILSLYNAVANEGVMLRPQFVKEIRHSNGEREILNPVVLNPEICKKSTLKSLQIMLEGVVKRGTAKNIRARGFDIAGKTGTSKIARGSSGYGDKYQASFCGYFPAENPKYSCIVVIQGPTRNIYGAKVSGTVFKEIADKVYASGFERRVDEDQLLHEFSPFSKHGNYEDMLVASKVMGIDIQDKALNNKWIVTKASKKGINVQDRNFIKGLVPNVLGMGLIDALYLLESEGLVVKVIGSGFVKDQSITPGLKVLKGQSIIINLS